MRDLKTEYVGNNNMPKDWFKIEGRTFFPFGPPIFHGRLPMNIINEVQTHIDKVRGDDTRDYGDMLAGRIKQQYDISDLCSDDVYTVLKQCAIDYMDGVEGMTGFQPNNIGKDNLKVDALWVNIQKEREYNPPHLHDGMFSFVFYTKNDLLAQEAFNNEFDIQKGQQLGGTLELRYGEMQFFNFSNFSILPEVGDIVLFPSWVSHHVHQFYKPDAERISVAGNFQWNW